MADRVSIQFPDLGKIIRQLKIMGANVTDELAAEMDVAMENVSTRAKDEFVPVDLGNLKGSIRAVPAVIENDGSVVAGVEAGGTAAPYAAAVHEATTEGLRSSPVIPPSWRNAGSIDFNVGGPKYLERPLDEARQKINAGLKKGLDKAVAEFKRKT